MHLPRPLLALAASGMSAALLGAWPEGRYAGLMVAASVFAVAYAAACASRTTPGRSVSMGVLAGLASAPLPLALAAAIALHRLTRGRTAANDNRPPRWDAGLTFAPPAPLPER